MENNNKPKLEESGALWIKKSKTGNNFLTGVVKTKSGEEVKVIIFKNKYKTEGSNQPDYRVYFDNAIQSVPQSLVTEKEINNSEKTKKASKNEETVNIKNEEIPF